MKVRGNGMNKKTMALLLCFLLLLGSFGGCGKQKENESFKIVCTVFPVYEWVSNIVGDAPDAEVILLIDNGTDLHSYEPTTQDIVQLLSADLVVYIGGTSETWVEQTLARRQDGEYRTLDLKAADGVTLRQISAESVLEEESETHSHSHGHSHEHTHGSEDEHLWLSLRNAAACSTAIAQALEDMDAERADVYQKNRETYVARLNELDALYTATVAEADCPTMLFADRFPFVYLAEDYGIRYVAAFEGCTTETDATPETILHLAEHADEWGLQYIFVTETSDFALAQSVRNATAHGEQEIVCLDSMQAVTQNRIREGETYLGIMEQNLRVLQRVFGAE